MRIAIVFCLLAGCAAQPPSSEPSPSETAKRRYERRWDKDRQYWTDFLTDHGYSFRRAERDSLDYMDDERRE
jgi:hypothetical protein